MSEEVVHITSQDGLRLMVTCDLDFERAERVAGELTKYGEGPIILDLTRCQFIDSTGLGVLVHTLRHYQDHGIEIQAVHVLPQVFEVLEIVGVVDVFGRDLFVIIEEPSDMP